jgi:phosphoglucosamine mutase
MRIYPQVLLNVPVRDRDALEADDAVAAAVRSAEGALGDAGRVLVRASGTEPLVRVMVEAETAEVAEARAEEVANVVRARLGA